MWQSLYLEIEGIVQGVGFRLFVYQLATTLGSTGWVKNSSEGVFIKVEGDRFILESFLNRLINEKPAIAQIDHLRSSWGNMSNYSKFQIETSTGETKQH